MNRPVVTITRIGPTLAEKTADCEARLARAKRNKKRRSHIALELEGYQRARFTDELVKSVLRSTFSGRYGGEKNA